MWAINQSKNIIISKKVKVAENFFSRLTGLIGTKQENEHALHIRPCSSVHTWFMGYPIDVVFLDCNNKIIKILHSMPPYKFGPIIKKAQTVLELPSGLCNKTGTHVGDIIRFSKGG